MASILNVDTINNAAGTSALTIDSSGNVNIPGHVIYADGNKLTADNSLTSTSTSFIVNGSEITVPRRDCSEIK